MVFQSLDWFYIFCERPKLLPIRIYCHPCHNMDFRMVPLWWYSENMAVSWIWCAHFHWIRFFYHHRTETTPCTWGTCSRKNFFNYDINALSNRLQDFPDKQTYRIGDIDLKHLHFILLMLSFTHFDLYFVRRSRLKQYSRFLRKQTNKFWLKLLTDLTLGKNRGSYQF